MFNMHSFSSFAFSLSLLQLIFNLSVPVAADIQPFNNSQAYKDGTYGNYTRQHYLSDEFVVGPVANVLKPAQDGVSPSKYVLWAPGGPSLPRTHPMIIEAETLSVIWSGPVYGYETMGPTVQTCNGTDYITWWAGVERDGYKQGRYYMYNSNYELVFNISAHGNLSYADAHEIFLTPECTAVITAYQTRPYDLSYYNITDGWLMDSYFQEIDLATNKLLFEWQASASVNITDAIWKPPNKDQGKDREAGYDFFHLNSVEKDRHGNFLLSARHTCTLYYVSGANGNVIWRLGGPRNDFKDISGGKATDFAWQHHARWVDEEQTQISLFDDRNSAYHSSDDPLSRGMIVSLDYSRKEVKLERTYAATQNIQALREGSMQVLQDSPVPGNAIVGYGHEPAWTEYAPNGTVLWDVAFGPIGINRYSADNYRAIKVNWTGTPTWSPSIAPGPRQDFLFNASRDGFEIRLKDESGVTLVNDTAYFSWNGATDIKSWVVLASNETSKLNVSSHFWAEVRRTGFEDHVFVGANTKYVAALAINGSDHVLGMTGIMDMSNFAMLNSGVNATNGTFDTRDLTTAWMQYVEAQGANSVFIKLRGKWHDIRTNMLHTSTPVAAGLSAFALLAILALCSIPFCIYWRSRQRYMRARQTDYDFAAEKQRLQESEEVCFSITGDEDDDDDSEGDRSFYDDPYYKKEMEHEADISTLRSCSSGSSKSVGLGG